MRKHRLVEEEQLRGVESLAEFVLELVIRDRSGAVVKVSKTRKQFFPASFAPVHGDVGVLQELAGIGDRIAVTTTPTLAVTVRSTTVLGEGLADRSHDPVPRADAGVVVVAQGAAEHDELVAAEAGDGVGPSRDGAEPLGRPRRAPCRRPRARMSR